MGGTKRPRPSHCRYKVRYRDKEHALSVVRNFQKFSLRQEVPKRAYQCGHCKGWHITKTDRLGASQPDANTDVA